MFDSVAPREFGQGDESFDAVIEIDHYSGVGERPHHALDHAVDRMRRGKRRELSFPLFGGGRLLDMHSRGHLKRLAVLSRNEWSSVADT